MCLPVISHRYASWKIKMYIKVIALIHIEKSTWLKFNIEILMKTIIPIFIPLLTDSTRTCAPSHYGYVHQLGFFQHELKLCIQIEPICTTPFPLWEESKSMLLGDAFSSSVMVRRGRRLVEVREGATVAIKYAVDPQHHPSRNPATHKELGRLGLFSRINVI